MNTPNRPRGRPPRVERNIAIWLAHTWFEQAENLSAWKACLAVRDIWVRHGFVGLGGPQSHASKAIFPILRAAAHRLGAGETVIWPGHRYPDELVGAGAMFVPADSPIRSEGRRFHVDGPCWYWTLGWERARLFEDRVAPMAAHPAK